MDMTSSMEISASGMRAQGARMRVIAENVANADTLPTQPGQEPYRRKVITFQNELDRERGIELVEVGDIKQDLTTDFDARYMPGHPAADERGYVNTPNVNIAIETMDMREAQRSYEANLNMIEMSRSMMMRTVDLLRD
ncbi:MAG: flagellar basal body rod protein FlgC [Rickettsiales bacterium]|nr:flagellar basal body rod protein FlgC [Rickettsiales bacterium]